MLKQAARVVHGWQEATTHRLRAFGMAAMVSVRWKPKEHLADASLAAIHVAIYARPVAVASVIKCPPTARRARLLAMHADNLGDHEAADQGERDPQSLATGGTGIAEGPIIDARHFMFGH